MGQSARSQSPVALSRYEFGTIPSTFLSDVISDEISHRTDVVLYIIEGQRIVWTRCFAKSSADRIDEDNVCQIENRLLIV